MSDPTTDRPAAPRVLVVPTARPTFVVEAARARADAARRLVRDLGGDVVGPADLVMSADDVEAARPFVREPADLVVHVCATFCDANPALELYRDLDQPVLLWAFREPGEVGDRLWLNSLCGANLIGHALVGAGHDVRLCHGDPDDAGVREILARAMHGELPPVADLPSPSRERADESVAEAALARVAGRRIGALGDAPTGFTPSAYDERLLHDRFGLEVEPWTLDELFAGVDAVDHDTRSAELDAATTWQPSLGALDPAALDTFAGVTVALRTWHDDRDLDALAIRCWPEIPECLGVCPCSALSRLADEHVPTQCERDVYGATTMLLLDALDAGPTFLVDTVDLDADANLVRIWHCGSAATQLARDPANATQSLHANRKVPVVGDFPLRDGPVVLTRLTEDPERPGSLRMLIASGTALDAPNRFQGNTADVHLDGDAREFVTGLVTGGFPHHTVVAWRDVRPGLRAVADALDIRVVEY